MKKVLNIDIKATDNASKEFDKARGSLRELLSTDKGGGVDSVAQTARSLGKLAQVFAVVEIGAGLASSAIDGVGAATAMLSGNAEKANEALDKFKSGMQQIPIVGRAMGLGLKIGEAIFGDERDAEKYRQRTREMEEHIEKLKVRARELKAAADDANRLSQSLVQSDRQIQALSDQNIFTGDPLGLALRNLDRQAQTQMEAARQRAADAQSNLDKQVVGSGSHDQALRNLREAQEQVLDLEEVFSASRERLIREAGEKRTQTLAQLERDQAAQVRAAAIDRLRQSGDLVGAEVAQIDERYDRIIETIKERGEELKQISGQATAVIDRQTQDAIAEQNRLRAAATETARANAADQQVRQAMRFRDQFENQMFSALQQRVALGDREAENQLRMMRAARDRASMEQQINDAIKDGIISAGEAARVRDLADQMQTLAEQRQEDFAGPRSASIRAQDASRLSGTALAAQDRLMIEQLKHQAKQVEHARKSSEYLERIVALLERPSNEALV